MSVRGRSLDSQCATDCGALVRAAIQICYASPLWQPRVEHALSVQSEGRLCKYLQTYVTLVV